MSQLFDPPRCCRFCGKALSKYTRAEFWNRDEYPKSRDEARARIANLGIPTRFHEDDHGQVLWVDYWDTTSLGYDGEGLFCTRTCGYKFGRRVALDLPHVRMTRKPAA